MILADAMESAFSTGRDHWRIVGLDGRVGVDYQAKRVGWIEVDHYPYESPSYVVLLTHDPSRHVYVDSAILVMRCIENRAPDAYTADDWHIVRIPEWLGTWKESAQ